VNRLRDSTVSLTRVNTGTPMGVGRFLPVPNMDHIWYRTERCPSDRESLSWVVITGLKLLLKS